ncbi:MAG: DUF1698 domain-containing protein [Fimbriimonadaceae bacterium]|nr:DUF1698 domain-containing protein [Fimbriimonadaceae bacterium]
MSAAPHLDDLLTRVESFPFWYHKIELPGGVVTPGWAPLVPEAYKVPADLTGKRVLDIGAWDGYWTFEALKRGAAEVVAIDDFSDYLGHLDQRDRAAWETFDLCRSALGYTEAQCKRIETSVYNLDPAVHGLFDVVFFFGTLYHLRYPLLALDLVSTVCTGDLFVETHILDDFSPYNGGFGHGYPGRQVVMEFYPGDELGQNHTNWWAPTQACLGMMMLSAGFQDIDVWKLADDPREAAHCRGFAHGVKSPAIP